MNYIWISDKILKFINLKSQIPNIFPKSQIILPPKSQIPKILTPQIPNPKYHNTPQIPNTITPPPPPPLYMAGEIRLPKCTWILRHIGANIYIYMYISQQTPEVILSMIYLYVSYICTELTAVRAYCVSQYTVYTYGRS